MRAEDSIPSSPAVAERRRRTREGSSATGNRHDESLMMTRPVFADPASLARGAAEEFLVRGREAIASRGRFLAALAGGSTPRAAHAEIARRRDEIDWATVHLFWGDERCVPPGDPQSNYRMARETLLSRVPLSEANVHRWPTELPPADAAARYEEVLTSIAGAPPILDLVFLGLGADGHTASLFPGSAALSIADRSCAANFAPALGEWRLTMTFPALNAAREALFLVEGESKREIVRKIEAGEDLPAARVRAARTLWFLDRSAAGE
jgi:6-phosphogluconolactonase